MLSWRNNKHQHKITIGFDIRFNSNNIEIKICKITPRITYYIYILQMICTSYVHSKKKNGSILLVLHTPHKDYRHIQLMAI